MASGKNVVVLGSGLMGSSIAADLLESSSVSKVGVIDSNGEKLKGLQQRVLGRGSASLGTTLNLKEKLETIELDVARENEKLKEILSKYDLGIGALPHGIAETAVHSAIDSKIDFVDLIFSWRHKDSTDLDARAKRNGITIVPACGLAPGLTNILAKYGADQMEEVDSVKIFVGGIPEVPKPPLSYRIVFSIDSVLEEYVRDALIVRNGKKVIAPALSEVEEITFQEFPDQKFEAFITDGLSTLPETLTKVKDLEEKTVRWKGHAEQVALLIDLGFFSERPLAVGRSGNRVSPRALLSTLLDKKLAMHQGDKDMTLLRVAIKGRKKKGDKATRIHQYEMVDRYDQNRGMTSMARTTAYPCSAVAQMILDGKITENGFIPPELAIRYDRFDEYVSRLSRKGLDIKEREFLAEV